MNADKQTNNTFQEMERLVIEVGNPEFEPGLTHLQLDADGQVQIENRLYQEEGRYEFKVDQKEAAAMISGSRVPEIVAKAIPSRHGLPDEPLYTITIYRGKEPLQTVRIWRSDLAKMGELNEVIRSLQQIVEQASNGKALL